jgi:hypothetical protein
LDVYLLVEYVTKEKEPELMGTSIAGTHQMAHL